MLVRDRARVLVLAVASALFVLAGCARTTEGPGAREVGPAEIVTVAPVPRPTEEPTPARVVAKAPAEPVAPDATMFPAAWRSPPAPTSSFAEEVAIARGLHAQVRFLSRAPRATPMSGDAGTDKLSLAWLSKLLELRERADRVYASAWVADDATPEGRVEALSEATTLARELEVTLAAAGYEEIPTAWKTEPLLHATFEDIAHGPVRRLGEESRALAAFCAASADRDHVRGHAADNCRRAAARTTTTSRASADQEKGGCACAKGDPLCTTSDWCK